MVIKGGGRITVNHGFHCTGKAAQRTWDPEKEIKRTSVHSRDHQYEKDDDCGCSRYKLPDFLVHK